MTMAVTARFDFGGTQRKSGLVGAAVRAAPRDLG